TSSLLATRWLFCGQVSGRSVLIAATADALPVALVSSQRLPTSLGERTSSGSATLAIAMRGDCGCNDGCRIFDSHMIATRPAPVAKPAITLAVTPKRRLRTDRS